MPTNSRDAQTEAGSSSKYMPYLQYGRSNYFVRIGDMSHDNSNIDYSHSRCLATSRGDFFNWIQGTLNSIIQDRRALMVSFGQAIWKSKNEKVWNNRRDSLNGVLYLAKHY